MTISPEALVNREVQVCLSYLVSTLAQNMGAVEFSEAHRDLSDMTEQAFELACPIDDWEEAAIQDGWKLDRIEGDRAMVFSHTDGRVNFNSTWGELCEEQDLEPYQREVFEHWAVSQWFGEKLQAKGEKVDFDFAGLVVWARTCSGQGIASDSVVEAICADLDRTLDERDTELATEGLTDAQ